MLFATTINQYPMNTSTNINIYFNLSTFSLILFCRILFIIILCADSLNLYLNVLNCICIIFFIIFDRPIR